MITYTYLNPKYLNGISIMKSKLMLIDNKRNMATKYTNKFMNYDPNEIHSPNPFS